MTTASLLVVLGCSLGAVRTTFTPLETTLLTKTKLGNSRGRSGSQNYHRMQRLQRAALPYTSLPSGRAGMNFKLQIVHSEENGREMCNVQKRRHFLASIAASSGLTIPKYVRSCEDDAPISKKLFALGMANGMGHYYEVVGMDRHGEFSKFFSSLRSRRSTNTNQLKILEIGVGSGPNMMEVFYAPC
mmetsp:Transcript_1168/g.1883  ORF Transcript_1168/g.1883 Transcript_1168/m.1883 type:complete len:187 (+) Transcript_1168:75-635(+)